MKFRMLPLSFATLCAFCLILFACGGGGGSGSGGTAAADASVVDLKTGSIANPLAYIPPQCFTRTQDTGGGPTQNPCYACHAESAEPNYNGQAALQLAYDFPRNGPDDNVANPWTNLFADRAAAIAAITDDAVKNYVAQDNYRDGGGRIALAAKLTAGLPASWDVDGNGWGGYVPDAWFNFDAQGFDRAPDGGITGWRAFAYYPFPGTFMPTNGAFDDVLIRLPAVFRQNAAGALDLNAYAVNLAIVESLIKKADIPIPATDESILGVDLDNDGSLGTATRVRFHWDIVAKDTMTYVGLAKSRLVAGTLHIAPGLFPEGTEFLHSVRYLNVLPDGTIRPSPRMKELRYSYKRLWMTYSDLDLLAKREAKDQALNPDQPESFSGDAEHGLVNNQGWTYQGFIEAADGSLRPQSREETLFCMGCHTGLSATEDGAFAFPRKLVSGSAYGWRYWADGPVGIPDAVRRDGQPEFATYLRNNGAGDEFRANAEVKAKFFNADGSEKAAAFAGLAQDVGTLMIPGAARALALNKAYWLVVREQSFARGRDAVLAPAANVWRTVRQGQATGMTAVQPAPRLALP